MPALRSLLCLLALFPGAYAATPAQPLNCAVLVIDSGGQVVGTAHGKFDPSARTPLVMKAAGFESKISTYTDMVSIQISKGSTSSLGSFPTDDSHLVQILLADDQSANVNCNW